MSKEVGLITDGTDKNLTSWIEGVIPLSSETLLPIITDVDLGTRYYLDPIQEKYIEITADYQTFISSLVYELPFVGVTANIQHFVEIIDEFITSYAISYGYSSIIDAVSYHNCGITAWEEESIAFNTWRANTESLMYDNIFSFTADGITLPDLAGFTSQAGYFDVGITSPSRPILFS